MRPNELFASFCYSPPFSKIRGSPMNRFGRSIAAVSAAFLIASTPQAAHAADMGKTLRITFQVAETGFDPVKIHDYYSGTVIEAIYDTLLTYDYLARPSKLAPRAAALPEVTDG